MTIDKFFVICLLLMIGSSCATVPKSLPMPDHLDVHTYGAYIDLRQNDGDRVTGELIAVNEQEMFVLHNNDDDKYVHTVPLLQISTFKLQYAKPPNNYRWTVPASTLASFLHGYFFIVTLPINLATTIRAHNRSIKAFQYTQEHLSYTDLKMFARFPQGIPMGIELHDLE